MEKMIECRDTTSRYCQIETNKTATAHYAFIEETNVRILKQKCETKQGNDWEYIYIFYYAILSIR